MLKNILSTFFLRIGTAVLSLGLLVASTRFLGAEGRGLVSLVLTGVGMISMLNGFMGGSSLVYLLSQRRDAGYLSMALRVSAAWAAAMSLAGSGLMLSLGLYARDMMVHIMLLSLLANLLGIVLYSLLAFGMILAYNLIGMLQVAVTLGVFVISSLMVGPGLGRYLAALYASYIVCLAAALASHSRARGQATPQTAEPMIAVAWGILKYGLLSQTGLVVQYLNYRLSYFFLNHYAGASAVGIYSVGAMLAESLWMLAGSIALVLYARVSSAGDSQAAQGMTVQLAKFSLVATLGMLGMLLAVPPRLLGSVFGRDFSGVGLVILCLAPGILALSFSMVINHYLAGTGMFLVNTLAAALGLAVTVAGNMALVPRLGLVGAGLTASAAYLAAAAFAVVFFLRSTGICPRRLLPGPGDLASLKAMVRG